MKNTFNGRISILLKTFLYFATNHNITLYLKLFLSHLIVSGFSCWFDSTLSKYYQNDGGCCYFMCVQFRNPILGEVIQRKLLDLKSDFGYLITKL
jgi:hypothetical protein